jgi:hypothetical protein
MIVTLPKPGDEGYDRAQKLVHRMPRMNRRGLQIIPIAYHAPIAHLLGTPCIYFNPKPKWHGYPLVHERNVVPILVHESVHCAVLRLYGLSEENRWIQDWIDETFTELGGL